MSALARRLTSSTLGVCAAEKFSETVFHNKVETLLRIG